MIETLVWIYLGMAVAQFMWSFIVYTKVGRDESMKEAYIEGAQKSWKEHFGTDYSGFDSKLNRFLCIMYWVCIIWACIKQGFEWPREVFYAIKYEIRGS